MTTSVTVETYSEEAEVLRIDPETHAVLMAPEIVPKGEKRMFHIHQRLALEVREVKTD